MINKTAILVCSVAVVVGLIIAGIMINIAYQNCERFEDEIRDNPESFVAKECMKLGFTVDQPESSLP